MPLGQLPTVLHPGCASKSGPMSVEVVPRLAERGRSDSPLSAEERAELVHHGLLLHAVVVDFREPGDGRQDVIAVPAVGMTPSRKTVQRAPGSLLGELSVMIGRGPRRASP